MFSSLIKKVDTNITKSAGVGIRYTSTHPPCILQSELINTDDITSNITLGHYLHDSQSCLTL
jgi:hypothetical protein